MPSTGFCSVAGVGWGEPSLDCFFFDSADPSVLSSSFFCFNNRVWISPASSVGVLVDWFRFVPNVLCSDFNVFLGFFGEGYRF